MRFGGVYRRLPVLIAAVAVGRLEAGEQVVFRGRHDHARGLLEIVPGVRDPARNAGEHSGRQYHDRQRQCAGGESAPVGAEERRAI